MDIKIKKLSEEAIVPKYSREGDAGLDLTATSITYGDRFIEYGTDLAIEIPQGFVGLLFPRSSVSNKSLALANSVGVIDSNYRGEIKLRFRLTDLSNQCYNKGERVGQLIIMPYPQVSLVEVDELSDTARGQHGFGSSGN